MMMMMLVADTLHAHDVHGRQCICLTVGHAVMYLTCVRTHILSRQLLNTVQGIQCRVYSAGESMHKMQHGLHCSSSCTACKASASACKRSCKREAAASRLANHMPAAACHSQHSAARLEPEQAAAAQPLTLAPAVLFGGWQLMQPQCPAVSPARWLGQHWLVLCTEALPPNLHQAHQVACRLWS